MAQLFSIHPANPQPRLVERAAAMVRSGGVIAYPTDSCYALGCQLGNKEAIERIRSIRRFDDRHHLTLVCRDLSEVAQYAQVGNQQYRLMKSATPGSFTFILRASREVPRRLQHPKRSTIGLRIPDQLVALALLEALGEPLVSATLMLQDDPVPPTDPAEIREQLEHDIDLVIDGGPCGIEPTTVIDLTGEAPELIRRGRGDPARVGIDEAA
jgi:tRNA threonylcarbamoyl adenosine modification protein (Sua5/YciO/YrdC/YwlC family)